MKMSRDEKELFYYLLDSPLVPDGRKPLWYDMIKASAYLHIKPWEWHDMLEMAKKRGESVPETEEEWLDAVLTAIQVEQWVREMKIKNPNFFDKEDKNPYITDLPKEQ